MKSKTWLLLILTLLFVAPFVQSNLSGESQPVDIIKLPVIISTISGLLRWVLLAVFGAYTIFNYKTFKNFTVNNFLFVCFYAVFLFYSIVDLKDIPRYFSLVLLTATVPSFICEVFKNHQINVNKIRIIIAVLVLISFALSFPLLLRGARFQGFLDNSNMYGITAVFWLSLFLLELDRYPLRKWHYLLLLLLISIILSGSRGSLVAGCLVIVFGFIKYLRILLKAGILLVVALFLVNRVLNLDFIFNRFVTIRKSAQDSGRSIIWERAFDYIDRNSWGWGMDAPMELIGTGNMHNVYVRMLLTMGYFFTILAIIPLILLLLNIVFDRRVPKVLIGFFVGLLAASFGEDFIIGLGSSLFVYILLFLGLINYYTKLTTFSLK